MRRWSCSPSPNPPARVSRPEACGLRHLALSVADLDAAVAHLEGHEVACEPIRVDEYFPTAASPSSRTRTACRWSFTSAEPLTDRHDDFSRNFNAAIRRLRLDANERAG